MRASSLASMRSPIRPIRSKFRQLTSTTARKPARALARPPWAMAIPIRWWSVTTSAATTTSASSLPTLTIVPAYTDISATIAWKDSSNKEGLRPSAEDYAKLLSLTADGAASDMLPVVVDNGDDTYTVTYTGVRQYAYDDNGERHDVDYKITQADVSGYTTDNATVGNEGVITNTHEVAAPQPEPQSQPQPQPQPQKEQVATELAETGD